MSRGGRVERYLAASLALAGMWLMSERLNKKANSAVIVRVRHTSDVCFHAYRFVSSCGCSTSPALVTARREMSEKNPANNTWKVTARNPHTCIVFVRTSYMAAASDIFRPSRSRRRLWLRPRRVPVCRQSSGRARRSGARLQ